MRRSKHVGIDMDRTRTDCLNFGVNCLGPTRVYFFYILFCISYPRSTDGMFNRQEEEKLRRLEKRQDSLLEKKGKLEKLKEDYRVFRSQQRNETKNIRDWHIKRWWRSMWKEEMEVYENQVTKDEEHRQADERDLDWKLEKIDDELIDISDKKEKLRDDIEELKVKDSQEFWTSKLSAEGLLAAEAEVKRKDEKLKFIQEQLLEAMKKTGVANPELAAGLITQHERSSILLSETSKKSKVVAQGMQEIISQVEMTIHDSSNVMEQVASALLIIHDEHQEQMRRLKKIKPQVLKNVWESKAVFLAPLAPESPASLNRTA